MLETLELIPSKRQYKRKKDMKIDDLPEGGGWRLGDGCQTWMKKNMENVFMKNNISGETTIPDLPLLPAPSSVRVYRCRATNPPPPISESTTLDPNPSLISHYYPICLLCASTVAAPPTHHHQSPIPPLSTPLSTPTHPRSPIATRSAIRARLTSPRHQPTTTNLRFHHSRPQPILDLPLLPAQPSVRVYHRRATNPPPPIFDSTTLNPNPSPSILLPSLPLPEQPPHTVACLATPPASDAPLPDPT
ncbi:hypothetical protein ACLB2K_039993 [Fragaria x ananassa]